MRALAKLYLDISGTSVDSQLDLLIKMAKSLASNYISKPIEIKEIITEFGKIDTSWELVLAGRPITSVEQLRISTSFQFDTSGEYDTPTVRFIDYETGRLKLDQSYTGEFRAKYKSGYDYKIFQGETIVMGSETFTFTGIYELQDALDLLNTNTQNITVSYSDSTNKFNFVDEDEDTFSITFSNYYIANCFGFSVLTKSLLDDYDSDNLVSWFPSEIQSALLIILDKLYNISKSTSASPEFRRKKLTQQDGLQIDLETDAIPKEAKVLLDPFKRVFL